MDSQLEKTHGGLLLYMITSGKLLYVQKWKYSEIPTTMVDEEDRNCKINLFNKESSTTTFISD